MNSGLDTLQDAKETLNRIHGKELTEQEISKLYKENMNSKVTVEVDNKDETTQPSQEVVVKREETHKEETIKKEETVPQKENDDA